MIPDHWLQILPEALRGEVPEDLAVLSKRELLGMVSLVAAGAGTIDSAQLAEAEKRAPGLMASLPVLAQVFTVPVRIFADVQGSHRIQSDYTVGYSSRLAHLPGVNVFENTNPRIDSVGLYIVEGAGLMRYDPESAKTKFMRLSLSPGDTSRITVEKDFTYFVAVFTGRRDTVFTFGDMLEGVPPGRTEEHTAEWLFQMDTDEIKDLSPNDMMNVASLGDLDGVLLPPRKRAVKHFTLWVQVTDSKVGVLNRSQGSVLAELQGKFEYTDAYINQFKKK